MGLKDRLAHAEAQLRVWERERIVQDNKIQELINDNKTITSELHRQALLINAFAEHLKKLRIRPEEQRPTPTDDGSPEPGVLPGSSDSENQTG